MTQPASPPSPVTLEDVVKKIESEVGFDITATCPMQDLAVWFPQTPGGPPTEFRAGDPMPFSGKYLVFQMFEDESEIRVYCIPSKDADPSKMKETLPRLFRLSKRAPTFTAATIFSSDTLVRLIATDWTMVAGDLTPLEREREKVADFVESQKEVTGADVLTWDEMADLIRSGEYDVEDEEDEEDTKPPPPPAPSTPGGMVQ